MHWWLCPITHDVMREPVLARDGWTYEREAIEAWLADHPFSPVTRQSLSVDDLSPNRQLEDAIAARTREDQILSGVTMIAPDSLMLPELPQVIAHGTMGKIVHGSYRLEENAPAIDVAVRVLSLDCDGLRDYVMARCAIEAKMHRVAQNVSDRVCLTIGTCTIQDQSCLVMRRWYRTNLLVRSLDGLSASQIQQIGKVLFSTLTDLHAKGLIVRNIQPVTVLMDGTDNPVLSDFSLATTVAHAEYINQMCIPNDMNYVAPEMWETTSAHDGAVDVWAVGCIVLQMTTLMKPWGNAGQMEIVRKVCTERMKPFVPSTVPAAEAVRRCFEYSPVDRPSPADVAAALERDSLDGPAASDSPSLTRAERTELRSNTAMLVPSSLRVWGCEFDDINGVYRSSDHTVNGKQAFKNTTSQATIQYGGGIGWHAYGSTGVASCAVDVAADSIPSPIGWRLKNGMLSAMRVEAVESVYEVPVSSQLQADDRDERVAGMAVDAGENQYIAIVDERWTGVRVHGAGGFGTFLCGNYHKILNVEHDGRPVYRSAEPIDAAEKPSHFYCHGRYIYLSYSGRMWLLGLTVGPESGALAYAMSTAAIPGAIDSLWYSTTKTRTFTEQPHMACEQIQIDEIPVPDDMEHVMRPFNGASRSTTEALLKNHCTGDELGTPGHHVIRSSRSVPEALVISVFLGHETIVHVIVAKITCGWFAVSPEYTGEQLYFRRLDNVLQYGRTTGFFLQRGQGRCRLTPSCLNVYGGDFWDI